MGCVYDTLHRAFLCSILITQNLFWVPQVLIKLNVRIKDRFKDAQGRNLHRFEDGDATKLVVAKALCVLRPGANFETVKKAQFNGTMSWKKWGTSVPLFRDLAQKSYDESLNDGKDGAPRSL